MPAIVKRPLPNSMSPSAASIRCAAARLPFSITSFDASTIAMPLAVIEREPPVPLPACTMSLSPCSSLIALEGNAELRAQHLRERRRVALAVVERAGDQPHRAVILEHDLAEFDAGRRGDFEIGADRDAAQLAALAAFLLALGKIGVVGNLQRLVEHALEIAAVIGDAGGRRERHLRRLDEVALAQGQPVDAHLVGGAIDQAFHEIVGLGASGAAIGAHQRGVGQHGLDVDAHQRRAIDAGEILADVERQRARRDAGDVGAEIAVAGELAPRGTCRRRRAPVRQ